jgi:aminomethyltransferase
MKETALTSLHRSAGARMVEYAGYEMPVEYSGVINEHNNVRLNAGLFDVSHMGEFWIKGPNALNLLQYVTTNDVSQITVGKAQYNCFPNGKGGIVDDLIIYRFEENKYLMVVNASNMEKDWKWLNENNKFGAELENSSDQTSMIALQGPKSQAILQTIVKSDLSILKNFSFITETVQGIGETIISTTGYTGAGGYELFCFNNAARPLWEKLMHGGKPFGILPIGLAARDTLRLEMGYSLYGNDIDDTTSPIEAGLEWIVRTEKAGDFIDRERIVQQIQEGVKHRLIGFEMLDRGIPRHHYILCNSENQPIGHVTSGTMSPTLQKGIGMGYVNTDQAKVGNEIFVQIRDKMVKAIVVKFPFIKK